MKSKRMYRKQLLHQQEEQIYSKMRKLIKLSLEKLIARRLLNSFGCERFVVLECGGDIVAVTENGFVFRVIEVSSGKHMLGHRIVMARPTFYEEVFNLLGDLCKN